MPTRESAYVQAITAAGVVHILTRNCSAGDLDGCSCDIRKGGGGETWKWGGCSDSPQYGMRIARKFLDSVDSGKDGQAITRIHNNAVGRFSVRKTMEKMCKCHGVSGSCVTRTCWMKTADFKTVAAKLKKAYKKAKKINYENAFLQIGRMRNTKHLRHHINTRTTRRSEPPNKKALIFLEKSPNYCRANPELGKSWM